MCLLNLLLHKAYAAAGSSTSNFEVEGRDSIPPEALPVLHSRLLLAHNLFCHLLQALLGLLLRDHAITELIIPTPAGPNFGEWAAFVPSLAGACTGLQASSRSSGSTSWTAMTSAPALITLVTGVSLMFIRQHHGPASS